MPSLSQDSKKIRRLVEKLSDEDLRSMGPKDLAEAIEKMGLVYSAVRERANNELARARKLRGIRKGQGRRTAAQYSTDKELLDLSKLFLDVDEFRRKFKSWKDARATAEEVIGLIKRFGSAEDFLTVVGYKEKDEADDRRRTERASD